MTSYSNNPCSTWACISNSTAQTITDISSKYGRPVTGKPGWCFFLRGITETAEQAIATANSISTLFKEDGETIYKLGRIAKSCQRVYAHLQENGIIAIQTTSQKLDINRTTVNRCLTLLLEKGIVEELTGYKRNRLYAYSKYIQILADGADPI